MARPKKGTPEAELATMRWRKTMEEKYGDKLHEHMAAMGHKGGIKCNKLSGFACPTKGADGLTGPERAQKCGAIGGYKSKRGPAKKKKNDDCDREEEELSHSLATAPARGAFL